MYIYFPQSRLNITSPNPLTALRLKYHTLESKDGSILHFSFFGKYHHRDEYFSHAFKHSAE